MQTISLDVTPDWLGRWTYERLRLLQPHVEVLGLYRTGDWHWIVVPNLQKVVAEDGTPLGEWFAHKCRAVGTPVRLTGEVPQGAELVDERSLDEVVTLVGSFRTERDVLFDLDLELPPSFPAYETARTDEPGVLSLRVARDLLPNEKIVLSQAAHRIGGIIHTLQVEVDSGLNLLPTERFREGDIDLFPSRRISGSLSHDLCDLMEADEEYWIDRRADILADPSYSLDLPSAWNKTESRCIVNASASPPLNIRNYLSLYQRVTIAAPLLGHEEEVLKGLDITLDELAQLMVLGRVQLLFPQSVDRYPLRLLEVVTESAPENVLFSRKLAAMTVLDSRKRLPLLYPPLAMADRYVLLRALNEVAGEVDNLKFADFIHALVVEVANVWLGAETVVHRQGAMGASMVGPSSLIGAIANRLTGVDQRLEYMYAATTVDWAGALGATAFPVVSKDYSEEGYTEMLASLYTGLPKQAIPNYQNNLRAVISSVLSVANDVPVTEFAKDFAGGDVDRFRGLVNGLTRQAYKEEELEEVLDRFNRTVISYESRAKWLQRWDIKGLIFLFLPSDLRVSLGLWVVERLFAQVAQAHRHSNMPLGATLDALEALVTNSTPDAILVHRIRERNG